MGISFKWVTTRMAVGIVPAVAITVLGSGVAFACGGGGGGGGGTGGGGGGWQTSAVCPSSSALGAAAAFSEFGTGNASRGQSQGDDIEGNAAYGGNATLDNEYIGPWTDSKSALVVGGNINVLDNQLTVDDGGTYGGSISQPVTGTMVKAQPSFSFSATGYQLSSESQALANQPTTQGDTISLSGNQLYLTGTNAALNVFDLSAGQLAPAATTWVNVPVGSVTLINVPDQNLSNWAYQDMEFYNGSYWQIGSQYNNSAGGQQIQYNTMFNFPQAQSISLSGANLVTNILAPQANFSFNDGVANANLYAASINGNFQGDLVPPITGCTGNPSPPPSPCSPKGWNSPSWSRPGNWEPNGQWGQASPQR